MTFKVAVIVGSLRKDSLSRSLALALADFGLKQNLDLRIAEIGDLELFNSDLDTDTPPEAWQRFRSEIVNADAVLFVTPEYNRSVPAPLKNALDVASRPYGKSAWNGKPGGVITIAPGLLGGFGANHHLRQSLVFLNVPMLQQPEAYISNIGEILVDGKIVRESTVAFLQEFLTKFEKWIEIHTISS